MQRLQLDFASRLSRLPGDDQNQALLLKDCLAFHVHSTALSTDAATIALHASSADDALPRWSQPGAQAAVVPAPAPAAAPAVAPLAAPPTAAALPPVALPPVAAPAPPPLPVAPASPLIHTAASSKLAAAPSPLPSPQPLVHNASGGQLQPSPLRGGTPSPRQRSPSPEPGGEGEFSPLTRNLPQVRRLCRPMHCEKLHVTVHAGTVGCWLAGVNCRHLPIRHPC